MRVKRFGCIFASINFQNICMRNLIYSIPFFLSVFFGYFAQAQSITGKITDAGNNLPLPGATVAIDGTTLATMADYEGNFVLAAKAGTWTLSFTYVGYTEQQMQITLAEGETKELGTVGLKSDVIGLDEMLVTASFAQDRKTPVAFSDVKPEMILEKLGNQEFPEILKSTPSIYATKSGGGFGDSRINMRGFDGNNIGVLINGVPVNDMEWGKVYWSNWAGLSDVTRTMQVQRGLGYSKLALSSVGGTINIITKSTDAEKGGAITYGIGNDGTQKENFSVSTGLTDKGWALTLSGGHNKSDGYIEGTNYEAWSYFINVAKRIGDNQSLSFTAFGAPQWHNQRGGFNTIENYRTNPRRLKYNPYTGFRNGQVYNTGYAYNVYHKPQMSLNHQWSVNPNTSLSTAVYASFGRGGGRRLVGTNTGALSVGYPSGDVSGTYQTAEGYLDFDRAVAENAESVNGSKIATAIGTNEHDWYGIVSSLNSKLGDINLTAGVDARYYKGYHTDVVDDLMGGEFLIINDGNVNRDVTQKLYPGDVVSRDYFGEVMWEGLFLQAEYVGERFSAFISGTGSYSSYRRTDRLKYTPENQVTEWQNFVGYSGKGGLNFNITKNQYIFVNGGYFSKAPFFSYVFISNNIINPNPKPENVLSTEVGYGFSNKLIKTNLTVYRTSWMNKSYATRQTNAATREPENVNMENLNALHQGVELEFVLKPTKKIDFRTMISVGDWKWAEQGTAVVTTEAGDYVGTFPVYSKDIHVGDAAQTTAAVGVDIEVLPKVKIGADFNHYDRLFANFSINSRQNILDSGKDSWQLPAYQLLDLSAKYSFKLGKLDATLVGNVNNVLDTEYLAEAYDGGDHDALTSFVYYGFGRTWSATLKIKF